jgi:hypothetical protein
VNSAGDIFVTDTQSHCIRKITVATNVVSRFAGGPVSGYVDDTGTIARFHTPLAITIDSSDYLYVSDGFNKRIRRVSPTAVVTTLVGSNTA